MVLLKFLAYEFMNIIKRELSGTQTQILKPKQKIQETS